MALSIPKHSHLNPPPPKSKTHKKNHNCAGSSALTALMEFSAGDCIHQTRTLDLRGETLLRFVAFLWPSNPEQIPLPGMWCRMSVTVLCCVILVPSKLNNGCSFSVYSARIWLGIFISLYWLNEKKVSAKLWRARCFIQISDCKCL